MLRMKWNGGSCSTPHSLDHRKKEQWKKKTRLKSRKGRAQWGKGEGLNYDGKTCDLISGESGGRTRSPPSFVFSSARSGGVSLAFYSTLRDPVCPSTRPSFFFFSSPSSSDCNRSVVPGQAEAGRERRFGFATREQNRTGESPVQKYPVRPEASPSVPPLAETINPLV